MKEAIKIAKNTKKYENQNEKELDRFLHSKCYPNNIQLDSPDIECSPNEIIKDEIKSDNIKFLNCRKSVYQKYKDIGNYIVVDGRHFKDSSKSTSARNMLFKNVIVKSLQEGLKVINTTMTESPNLKEYLLSKGIPLSVININYSEVKLSYEEMIACFMGAKAVFSVGNAGGISTKLFIQCNLYVNFDPNNPDYKSWIWSDSTFGYGGTSMFNARLQKLDSQFKTSKFTDEDVAGSILWSTVKNLNPPLISESSFIDETKITYI